MASADQTSDVVRRPARGTTWLRLAIGKRLTGLRRFVLGLGRFSDERGHGVTELAFDQLLLVVRPGPNEDYIVVEQGPSRDLDPEYWRLVEAHQMPDWSRYLGARLESVGLYTDGRDDVALVFYFDENKSFSLVLCDTDLLMAEALEPFDEALEEVAPQLRERISADPGATRRRESSLHSPR